MPPQNRESLFCADCRRYFPGPRTVCPVDGMRLVRVSAEAATSGSPLAGSYDLGEEIATGGMATVYRARDRRSGQDVAVKLLKSAFLHDSKFVQQFFLEAHAVARIDHPNVVALHEIGQTPDGHLFIVMELLGGLTLADYVWRRGRLPADRALRLFIQIVRALGAAHRAGVVHGDVKAGNVLFASPDPHEETVKVVDFGLARLQALDDEERTSSRSAVVAGTPQYMAPEQFSGASPDERSDLYASGILLYYLLAGRVPFDDSTPEAIGERHVRHAPPPLGPAVAPWQVPPELEQLYEQLLSKRPSNRPRSADEVEARVHELLLRAEASTEPIGVVGKNGDAAAGNKPNPEPGASAGTGNGNGNGNAQGLPRIRFHVRADSVYPVARVVRWEVTVLDIEVYAVDEDAAGRPETAQQIEAALRAICARGESAGAHMVSRAPGRARFAFGLRDSSHEIGGDGVDLGLHLLNYARTLGEELGTPLIARAGVAAGPVYLVEEDRLASARLLAGARPDIAARLITLARDGGLVVDDTAFRARAQRLAGAIRKSLRTRHSDEPAAVFEFLPTSNAVHTSSEPIRGAADEDGAS